MKELDINILRTPSQSIFRRFLGLLYIIVAILWLLSRIIFRDSEAAGFPVPILDMVYTVFFGIAGIIFIIDSYGISMSRWFGDAYIKIDMSEIRIKKGVFSKEQLLKWSAIEQVEFSVIKINFTLSGNGRGELNYDNLDYEHIQEIKQAIKEIAAEKNIRIILPR